MPAYIVCHHSMPRRSPRSASELTLPEAEDIVLQDAELRQMLLDMHERQARGASKGGRYNKHDTARLRFIRDKAFMSLRLGMLMPDVDLKMLRLEPQEELRRRGGADWAAMETWAELHGKDPRSQRKDGILDETQQVTMLRWISRNVARFVAPAGRRGAPAVTRIGFGIYADYTVGQLCGHCNTPGKGGTHLLPPVKVQLDTPLPGPYVLWLLGGEFDWQFPRHLKLFLALRQLESVDFQLNIVGRGWVPIIMRAETVQRYDAHVATAVAAREEDADPFSGGSSSQTAAPPVCPQNLQPLPLKSQSLSNPGHPTHLGQLIRYRCMRMPVQLSRATQRGPRSMTTAQKQSRGALSRTWIDTRTRCPRRSASSFTQSSTRWPRVSGRLLLNGAASMSTQMTRHVAIASTPMTFSVCPSTFGHQRHGGAAAGASRRHASTTAGPMQLSPSLVSGGSD